MKTMLLSGPQAAGLPIEEDFSMSTSRRRCVSRLARTLAAMLLALRGIDDIEGLYAKAAFRDAGPFRPDRHEASC